MMAMGMAASNTCPIFRPRKAAAAEKTTAMIRPRIDRTGGDLGNHRVGGNVWGIFLARGQDLESPFGHALDFLLMAHGPSFSGIGKSRTP